MTTTQPIVDYLAQEEKRQTARKILFKKLMRECAVAWEVKKNVFMSIPVPDGESPYISV